MKQFLTATGVFIGILFGLFIIINLLVILIFPVSWHDVVTCPAWVVIYFIIGVGISIMGVDAYITDKL